MTLVLKLISLAMCYQDSFSKQVSCRCGRGRLLFRFHESNPSLSFL